MSTAIALLLSLAPATPQPAPQPSPVAQPGAQPAQPAQPYQPQPQPQPARTTPTQPQPAQPAQPQPAQPVAQPAQRYPQPAQPVAQPAQPYPQQPVARPTPAPPPPREVNTGPALTPEHVRDINRTWSGVGIGYHNGLWGQGFAQGLKLDIPFGRRVGQHFGMRVHGTLVHPPPGTGGPFDPVINTGLELFGRGPVWLGIIRAYGGGGAWFGIRPNSTGEGKDYQFTGGGHLGIEVIVAPRMSFTVEIGGQGPGHGLRGDDAGASVMGGFMVYLGDIGGRR